MRIRNVAEEAFTLCFGGCTLASLDTVQPLASLATNDGRRDELTTTIYHYIRF